MSSELELVALLAVVAASVWVGWFLCSRALAHRVEDAQRIARISQQAADTLLKAAHTERAAADALEHCAKEIAAWRQEGVRMRTILDSLDATSGAVLTALVNIGAMKHIDVRKKDAMRGEGDGTDLPPPLDALKDFDRLR